MLGQLYAGLYSKASITAAADEAAAVAAEHGISGHAAALRWTVYHSLLDAQKGDAVVVGASSVAQLSSNLDSIDAGPLPPAVRETMDGVFAKLDEEDKVAYHF